MLGKGQHLHQVAGLAIVAEHLRADQETDFAMGKFADQLLHAGHGGIVRLTDAKNDFVLG